MKNQGNMSPPKEHSEPPGTGPPKNGDPGVSEKEVKIIVLQMLREQQENTDKQFSALRKTT